MLYCYSNLFLVSAAVNLTIKKDSSIIIEEIVRRDDRAVEGARLESVCRGNSTEGSNPSLSAIIFRYKQF